MKKFKFAARQKMATALIVLGSLLLMLGFYTASVYVALSIQLIVLLGVFLVLCATDRDTARLVRRLDQIQSQLKGVSKATQFETLQSQLKGIATTARSEEDDEECNLDGCIAEGNNVKADVRGREADLLDRVSSYLNDIDSYVNERCPELEQNIKTTEMVSIRRVLDWFRPDQVLGSPECAQLLSAGLGRSVEPWDVDLLRTQHSTKLAVILRQEDVQWLGQQLFVPSFLQETLLIYVGVASGGTEIDNIYGYEEIAPLDLAYGVRVFYPKDLVSASKFSGLIQYE